MSETIEVELPVKRRGRPPKIALDAIAESAYVAIQPDIFEKIAHWAYRLELANAMKAGLMDSESRHQEVARQREAIIASVIAEMKA